MNFQNYTLDTTAPIVNEAIVGADQQPPAPAANNGSDDAEVVNLERQRVTTVDAVASPASVPTGTTSTAIITVKDAAGRPIAGAQVIYDENRNGMWDGAAQADEESRYTDANGEARFAGLAGHPPPARPTTSSSTPTAGDDYDSGP